MEIQVRQGEGTAGPDYGLGIVSSILCHVQGEKCKGTHIQHGVNAIQEAQAQNE